MELIKCKYRIGCEMGACGNLADVALQPSRTGVRSRLHLCSACLREIVRLGGDALRETKRKGEK